MRQHHRFTVIATFTTVLCNVSIFAVAHDSTPESSYFILHTFTHPSPAKTNMPPKGRKDSVTTHAGASVTKNPTISKPQLDMLSGTGCGEKLKQKWD